MGGLVTCFMLYHTWMNKLTPKQESFAKKYIELGNASEAYRQSYNAGTMPPESIHVKANEVKSNVKVALRIEELQEKAQQRHNVTLDSLTKEYDEAKAFAYNLEQVSSAVSAINGKAKIHGFDKSTIDLRVKKVVKVIDMSGKE